jgi:aspartate aminotransferase/aminotransferase
MLRPNGNNSNTIPLTQFFHEWVHHLQDNDKYKIADGSRGKPSYPKDKAALNAVKKLYDSVGDVFPYGTCALGETKYRKQAAIGFTNEYNVDFDYEEIIFTTGGQFGIAATFYLIETLYPNSFILSPKPWYLNHNDIASMFSSEGFSAIPKKSKFIEIDILETISKKINTDLYKKAINKAKKENKTIGAFLFCNPSNPLGTVYRKDDWDEMLEIFDMLPEIPIIMDEAFAEVIFNKNYDISILHSNPKLKERLILMRSGTKALGFPGERFAVMSVPKKYLPIYTSFQSRLIGNPPLSIQAGMAKAMQTMGYEKKSKISDYYFSNFKFLKNELKKIENIKPIFEPDGGFYALYDFSFLKGENIPKKARNILNTNNNKIETDIEAAISLMVGMGKGNVGVATIPASGFGVDPKKLILRLSHSSYKEELSNIVNFLLEIV